MTPQGSVRKSALLSPAFSLNPPPPEKREEHKSHVAMISREIKVGAQLTPFEVASLDESHDTAAYKLEIHLSLSLSLSVNFFNQVHSNGILRYLVFNKIFNNNKCMKNVEFERAPHTKFLHTIFRGVLLFKNF